MLYVYAIFDAEPRQLPDSGIDGVPLRLISSDGLFAAVSEVAEIPGIEEQRLRVHEQIVRKLADNARAVLPARFGSVAPDMESLRALLQERAPEWTRALELVAGREQMTLRIFGVPQKQDVPPVSAKDSGGPGTRYLADKLRQHMAESSLPVLETVRRKLGSMVHAERIHRHDAAPLVASMYHLIDRGRGPNYRKILDEIASEILPMQVSASGPWPPYAFGRLQDTDL